MLTRKKGLKVDYDKLRAWKIRSAKKSQERAKKRLQLPARIKQRSSKRSKEEATYYARIKHFILEHPVCPVFGGPATEIHHSAKRDGGWLLLEYYWIALSLEGHRWVEDNKRAAEKLGLMRRITLTCAQETTRLISNGEDIADPVFYKTWDCKPFNPSR